MRLLIWINLPAYSMIATLRSGRELIEINRCAACLSDLIDSQEGFFFFFVPSDKYGRQVYRWETEHGPPERVGSFYVEALRHDRRRVTRMVYLARHGSHADLGHTLSGRSEVALSAAGREEARRLADRLAGVPLAAIHVSPRRRTQETAAIVAERHGLPVVPADALDEIDFGAWAGRRFADLADDPAWTRWNAERATAATPVGETMAAVAARAVHHVEAAASDGDLLCVSHCDVIRATVAHYLGLAPGQVFGFDCDPASLTTLALFPGGGRVVTLNERPA